MLTNHYKNDRRKREKFIADYLGGDGKVIDSFIVDNKHSMGLERHCVTDKGVIVIFNEKTNKIITKLIANKYQIKRLYHNVGREPPNWLIYLAQYHESLNYNYV